MLRCGPGSQVLVAVAAYVVSPPHLTTGTCAGRLQCFAQLGLVPLRYRGRIRQLSTIWLLVILFSCMVASVCRMDNASALAGAAASTFQLLSVMSAPQSVWLRFGISCHMQLCSGVCVSMGNMQRLHVLQQARLQVLSASCRLQL
jgi:hypothetical protein